MLGSEYVQYPFFLVGCLVGFEMMSRQLIQGGALPERAQVTSAVIIFAGVGGSFGLPALLSLLQSSFLTNSVLTLGAGGFSSIWGIFSAGLAVSYFLLRTDLAPWRLIGAVAFAFPFAWAPVRLSCAILHHHLGAEVAGIAGIILGYDGLMDLGRAELLMSMMIAVLFAASRLGVSKNANHAARDRFYLVVVAGGFGLFRLATEHTRLDVEPIFAGMYSGQIAGAALVAMAIASLLVRPRARG